MRPALRWSSTESPCGWRMPRPRRPFWTICGRPAGPAASSAAPKGIAAPARWPWSTATPPAGPATGASTAASRSCPCSPAGRSSRWKAWRGGSPRPGSTRCRPAWSTTEAPNAASARPDLRSPCSRAITGRSAGSAGSSTTSSAAISAAARATGRSATRPRPLTTRGPRRAWPPILSTSGCGRRRRSWVRSTTGRRASASSGRLPWRSFFAA